MRRLATILLAASFAVLFAHTTVETIVPHERATLQSDADAAWEGLSADQQTQLLATGETGQWLDELAVNYRDALAATPTGYTTRLERDNDGLWSIYAVPTTTLAPAVTIPEPTLPLTE
jgi:hypothetical protein